LSSLIKEGSVLLLTEEYTGGEIMSDSNEDSCM
jgi:hypothetical protein